MASNNFSFKQFTVNQSQSAMKVGTDGVLLGAWAADQLLREQYNADNILDIGTGTGVIALIMAQKCVNAHILGLDIEEEAAKEAAANFEQSKWSDRVKSQNISLQDFCKSNENRRRFDVVITNPPYFINSLKNTSQARIAARHTELLPYEDLVEGIDYALSDKGKLYIILPYEQSALFIALAAIKGLSLRRCVEVRGAYGRPVKRVLLKFDRSKGDSTTSQLTIETDIRGSYTDKYKELTADFYLKF